MRILRRLCLACLSMLAVASLGLVNQAQTIHYNGGLKYEI
jgi:hypothetical protein